MTGKATHGVRIITGNGITKKNLLFSIVFTITPTLPDSETNPGHINGKPVILFIARTEMSL
jgi:hypothetical protein